MSKKPDSLEDLKNLTAAGRAIDAQDWLSAITSLNSLNIPEVNSALAELKPEDAAHAYYLTLTTQKGHALRQLLQELLAAKDSDTLRVILQKHKGTPPETLHFNPASFSEADIRKRKVMLQGWQKNLLGIDKELTFGTSRVLDKLFSALTKEELQQAWDTYLQKMNDDLANPIIYFGLYSAITSALSAADFRPLDFRQKLLEDLRSVPGLENYALKHSSPSRQEAGESLSYAKLGPENAKIKHAVDQLLQASTLSQGVSALDVLSPLAGITETSPLFEAILYELEANADPGSGALRPEFRENLLGLLSTVEKLKSIVSAYPEYGQEGQVHYSPELEATIAKLGRKLDQMSILLQSVAEDKTKFDQARLTVIKTIKSFTGSRNVRGLFKGITLKPFEDLLYEAITSTSFDQLFEIKEKLYIYFDNLRGHKVGTPGIIKNIYERKRKELEEQKSQFAIPTSQDLAKTFLSPVVEKAYATWAEANSGDTTLYALAHNPTGFLPDSTDTSSTAVAIREAYRQLLYEFKAQEAAIDYYKKNRLGRELSKETPEIREAIDTALEEYKENMLRGMFPSSGPKPDLFMGKDTPLVRGLSKRFLELQHDLGLKQRSEKGEGGSLADEDREEYEA